MAEQLVAGRRAFDEAIGSGPPVAVVHGGLGKDHTCFRPWLDPLADRFTVICVDLLGNGRSEEPAGLAEQRDVQPWVDQLDALRRHLGLERWVVLGHSFGGFVAQTHPAGGRRQADRRAAPARHLRRVRRLRPPSLRRGERRVPPHDDRLARRTEASRLIDVPLPSKYEGRRTSMTQERFALTLTVAAGVPVREAGGDAAAALAEPPPVAVELTLPLSHRPGRDDERLLLGRSSSCDLVLAGDAVSRLHLAIEREAGAWWAIDLGSTNGTWLDDSPIRRARLRRGARLQLADALVHVG